MKVILELDIPDEVLVKEGVSLDELTQAFTEMKDELKDSQPDGTSVTLRIEP